MNLKIDAPKLRVTDMYAQFNKTIKDNGWKHLFEGEDGNKMKIRFLVNAIQPPELKTLMKKKLRNEPKVAKQLTAFMVLLKEKTASFEETRSVRDDNGNNSKQEKKSRKRPREDDTVNRKTTQKNQKTYNGGKKTEKEQKKDRSQLKCFNCGEYGHAAFKCPKDDLSKQQVADLLKNHDNKHKKKTSNYLLVCGIGSSSDDEKHIQVRICEGLYAPGILDSGATDMPLVPLRIAQAAMRNDPSIVTERLKEPVRLRLGDSKTESA